MDDKLTYKIAAYVDADASERDILAGAEMLLKLSRNKILYMNIVRAPHKFADKLLYELKKHLAIRQQKQTVRDVVVMDKQLSAKVEALVAKGKRSDHDSLPAPVQKLWEDCATVYKNIKLLHEHLQTMCDAAPCDRAEHLYQLRDLDKCYHEMMQSYDDYVVEAAPASEVPSDEQLAADLDNARKYLSKNKSKLVELRADASSLKKYISLLAKMQHRYDLLVQHAQDITQELRTELEAGGIDL